ncbi:MAG: 6-phosphofructokinase [Thermomicrobiales bacterium]
MERIAVLTSGGDAPGMNAAVRAVLRVGLDLGMEVYGVREGYEGLIQGGAMIRALGWLDGGGIMQAGGTILGTARSQRFRTPEGRREAVRHLLACGIEGLVVIGGDGSLSGAQLLYDEWPAHVAALAHDGLPEAAAWGERRFHVVGLPGSIDNDLYGTDMSIGADTALNTVVRNLDQLVSTADAHQRTFVVEVMGRNCGYLALMGALATGSEWVILPEEEMEPRWHTRMIESLKTGRVMGRRHDTVIVAEGARHTDGLPIRSADIQRILAERLSADARVTVLGHVQRGGSPSAFDRVLATRLGAAAVERLATAGDETAPAMLGLVANKPVATPLPEVVSKSRGVQEQIDAGNYSAALELRNRAFREALALLRTLSRAEPKAPAPATPAIALLTGDADAPGMNAALRTATRIALSEGYRVLGVENGFLGLTRGEFRPLEWMSVSGWARRGSTVLGAARYDLRPDDSERIAGHLREQGIGALICLGGWSTYLQAAALAAALPLPLICVPATIDNNLPCTDFSIGADTAINSIVEAVDKIKDAAVTTHRAFIIEVMGRNCGYLALMSALASGAEKANIPEERLTLARLLEDIEMLLHGFSRGKKLGIVIHNEQVSRNYDTDFLRRVLEEEGGEECEARSAMLGHLQRGGTPSPFDRLLGARFGTAAARAAIAQLRDGRTEAQVVGVGRTGLTTFPLADALREMDYETGRPAEQWWLPLRDLLALLAQPEPGWRKASRESVNREIARPALHQ